MNAPRSDLAALVGSRIAHDLASPLGAIANGVELLGLTGAPDGPELALISESVDNATARIKAFRIAFGAAPPDQTVPQDELNAVLAAYGRGGKVAIDWHHPSDLPRGLAKLVCLAVMCAESAMPWGGRIDIRTANDGWQVSAEASRLRRDPGLWDSLVQSAAPPQVQPSEVQFALIGPAAEALGRLLAVTHTDASVTLRF